MRIMIELPDGDLKQVVTAIVTSGDNPMTCATCHFWRSDPSGDVGCCTIIETEVSAVWARTTPDHFCAEWAARP